MDENLALSLIELVCPKPLLTALSQLINNDAGSFMLHSESSSSGIYVDCSNHDITLRVSRPKRIDAEHDNETYRIIALDLSAMLKDDSGKCPDIIVSKVMTQAKNQQETLHADIVQTVKNELSCQNHERLSIEVEDGFSKEDICGNADTSDSDMDSDNKGISSNDASDADDPLQTPVTITSPRTQCPSLTEKIVMDDADPSLSRKFQPDPHLSNSVMPAKKRPKYAKDTSLTCRLCSVGPLCVDTLRKHVHRHHRLHAEYPEYIFDLGGSIVVKENRGTKFTCKLCGFEDAAEVALFRHVQNEHKEKEGYIQEVSQLARKFICMTCSQSFNSVRACTVHRRKDHPETAEMPDLHACRICAKLLNSASSLKKHVRSQHGHADKAMCHLCPSTFASKYNLVFHLRTIHDDATGDTSNRTCATCHLKVSSEYALAKHVSSVHDKMRNHVCDKCGKAFGRKSSLVSHASIYHEPAEHLEHHVCQVCGKKFNGVRNLQRHVKFVHLRVYPWYCYICTPSKGFRQGYHFRNHLTSQHPELLKAYDDDPQIRSFSIEDIVKLRGGADGSGSVRKHEAEPSGPDVHAKPLTQETYQLVTTPPPVAQSRLQTVTLPSSINHNSTVTLKSVNQTDSQPLDSASISLSIQNRSK